MAMLSVALTRLDIERAIAPCPPLLGIEATLLDAAVLLSQSSLGCVLVVSGLPADTRPLGIITERDIVRGLAGSGRLDGSLSDIMTQPVVTLARSTITDGQMLWATAQRLATPHVPVVDDAGHTLGLLTRTSLSHALALAFQSTQFAPDDSAEMIAADGAAARGAVAEWSYLYEIAAALHASETTNRSILQTVPDLLLRVRQDGKYLEVLSQGNSPQFVWSEFPEGDGTVLSEASPLLPPEVIAHKQQYIQRAVATGQLQVFEQQVEIAGVQYYEEVRVVPLHGDETLVMVRDITDRKVLELALQSSEAKSRAILTTIPDLMFRVNAEGQYLEYVCNQRSSDIIPLTVDATGCYMADLLPEDLYHRQMHYLRLALDSQELQVYEQQIQIGDRWKFEEVRVTPFDEQSVLFMIRDMTERHQAAVDLQHRIDRERLIAQVTQNIRQSLDLDQILQTTVIRVRQFLAADRVLIYRFNAEWGGDMIVESVEPGWMSVLGSSVQDPCFTGELIEAYRQGKICQIDDVCQAGLTACHMALLSQFQVLANLAVPITCEGSLWGLLCVHQCVGPRQWQAEEVELLTQLTAQLAIALQQALLYQHLQAELQERQRAETILRSMVEGTAAVTGDDFFLALVRHIAADIKISSVLVLEVVDGDPIGGELSPSTLGLTPEPHLQTLAFWTSDPLQASLNPSLWRTPCQKTLQQGFFYCPTGVQALFPEDVDLVDLQADSYLGVALQDSQGRAIGGLCVLDTQPLAEPEQAIALLRVFAARAGAELERQRATRALECLNDELEMHVLQRTKELQDSEARFRRLAGNLPGMVYRYVTHPQAPASFTYVSPRSQELFGLEPAAMLQTPTLLWEHIHPDDLGLLQTAAISSVRDGFAPWNVEHRIVTTSGCVKWVQSAAQPTPLPNGDILWEGFSLDISERKQLELSLQASEAKLHYVLNSAIAAICNFWVYDDGTWECHYYSPGFEALLGYAPNELMAHKRLWMSRIHPEDLTTVIYPLYERIVAGIGTACYEYRVYRRDGSLRWVAATLTSQWDETEGVWVVTTVDTDISDRKQAELALQNKTSELEAIVNALPDIYFRLDEHGVICDYYCSNEALLYVPAAQFLGQPLGQVLPPALVHQFTVAIAEAKQTQALVTLEYLLQVPSGLQYFEARLRPLGEHQVIAIVRDISDRKNLEAERLRAQQDLQTQKDFLQRVVDSIPSCILVKDKDLQVQVINHAMADLYGLTIEEARGRSMLNFSQRLSGEQRRQFMLEDQAVMRSGQTLVKQDRVVTLNQQVRWYQTTLKAFVNDQDESVGLIVNSVDITERKQTEIALKNSEERLQLAVDGSGDGLWDWNILTGDLYLSPHWFRLLGFAVNELPGHISTWENRLHPEDKPWVKQALDRHLRDGSVPYRFEFRLLTKTGEWKWFLDYGKVVTRDAQGNPCRMMGMNRDISDRKRAEIALRQSEAQYRAIVEDQTELIARFFPDGSLCFVNEAFCRYFQVQRAAVLGQSYLQFLWVGDRDEVFQKIQAMSLEQPMMLLETRVVVQGEIRWTQWSNRMVCDDQGQLLEFQVVGRDITTAKQDKMALQQSRQQYRSLVDSMDAIVWEADPQTWQITFVSQQAERILGYPLTQWYLPNFWIQTIHPDDRDRVWEFFTATVASQQPRSTEYRMMAADGRVIWMRDTPPVLADLGNPLKLQGLLIDISDRKAAEAALFNSEQKFRGLFEMTGDAVMLLTTEGFFDCNPQTLKMFGCRSKEEFCSKHPSHFSPRHQPNGDLSEPLVRQHIQTAFRQGFCRFEWEHCQADGTEFPAEVLLCQMELQGQSILQAIVRDIRDRRQVEQVLQARMEQETLLGEIIRNIRQSLELDAILETTVTEVRRVFNADRALIFRLTTDGAGVVIQESVLPAYPMTVAMYFPDEWVPADCYEFYCAGQPRIVQQVAADEGADCLQNFMREFGVQSQVIAPIVQQDAQGKPRVWGLLSVHACAERRLWKPAEAEFLQQISNQVAIAIQQSELYQQLQDTNRHLARATRLKDEFLANMSHELRTPLNAILGLSEALHSPVFGAVNDKQRQFLSTIQASGKHLLALINDILDLAKMESGKLDLNLCSVPVQQLCQSSLMLVEQQALQKEVQLHLRLDLPLATCILADELRMRQVLVNLLNNAVKFTPAGGMVELVVSGKPPEGNDVEPDLERGVPVVEVPRSTSFLYFSVIDTGIGIASEDLGKLFQTFVQLDSGLTRHYEGTGLGLVLVRRITQLHGGKVSVHSAAGAGSRFTVALPWQVTQALASQVVVEPIAEDPEPLNVDATEDRVEAQPLILLAEDHPDNAEMVSSYLAAHGYRMLVANSGETAITVARNCSPDLVLMDIQMPEMDGLEAIRHLRSVPYGATVPIIALTALAMERDRDYCLAAGATEYLPKPISLSQLLQMIQRLLLSRSAP